MKAWTLLFAAIAAGPAIADEAGPPDFLKKLSYGVGLRTAGGYANQNPTNTAGLLTLDVRSNRPNYPTFVDLDFRSDQGIDASRSGRNFTCWTEIKEPNLNEYFTLVGARTHSGVVISGKAVKHPFKNISDIPGPVRLLGLAPTDDDGHGRSMDPAYIVKKSDSSKPTTVFVPFD